MFYSNIINRVKDTLTDVYNTKYSVLKCFGYFLFLIVFFAFIGLVMVLTIVYDGHNIT